MCFTVASDNVHLCHVSKMYCSMVALVRKVYDQIGRHGSSHDGCFCSMCLVLVHAMDEGGQKAVVLLFALLVYDSN